MYDYLSNQTSVTSDESQDSRDHPQNCDHRKTRALSEACRRNNARWRAHNFSLRNKCKLHSRFCQFLTNFLNDGNTTTSTATCVFIWKRVPIKKTIVQLPYGPSHGRIIQHTIDRSSPDVNVRNRRTSALRLSYSGLAQKSREFGCKSGLVQTLVCDDGAAVRFHDFVRTSCRSPTKQSHFLKLMFKRQTTTTVLVCEIGLTVTENSINQL